MSILNIKRADVNQYTLYSPVKVNEEEKIYLAKAHGPMVYFKANVHITEDTVTVVDAANSTIFQDFVDTLTLYFQNLCSTRSEEWFKGRHFPLEFIQEATSTVFKIEDKFYDQNKRRVRRTDLTEGDFEGEVVVEFDGLYFKGKDIKFTWSVKQVRLHKEIPDSDFIEAPEEPVEEPVEEPAQTKEDAVKNFADLLE